MIRPEPAIDATTTWLVRRHPDDAPLARLSDPTFVDMFWLSVAIEPLVLDPDEQQRVLTSSAFWDPPLLFEREDSGVVAEYAFASAAGPSDGRVTVRGLR